MSLTSRTRMTTLMTSKRVRLFPRPLDHMAHITCSHPPLAQRILRGHACAPRPSRHALSCAARPSAAGRGWQQRSTI